MTRSFDPNFLWTLISAKFNLQSRHWTLNRNRGFRGLSGSKAVMAMPVRSVRSHLVQTDPKKQNFSPELILRSIKIRPRSKIVFYYVLSQIPVQKSSLLIGYENPNFNSYRLKFLASTQRYIDSALFKFNPWARRGPKICKNSDAVHTGSQNFAPCLYGLSLLYSPLFNP